MTNLKVSKFISRYELQPIYSPDGEQKLHYVIDIFFDGNKFFPRIRRRDYFCIYPFGIPELCEEELLIFDNMEDWDNLNAQTEDEVLNKVKILIEHRLITTNNNPIIIRALEPADIPNIVHAFQQVNWPKSSSIFETYYQAQFDGKRHIWLAFVDNQFAGYVTLAWESLYQPFLNKHIPEIMDLNVLPAFRKRGIGSLLLDNAENKARTKSNSVGIGVGLYAGPDGGYGAAQRLYVKRGYMPDGEGVTYRYQSTTPGGSYPLDDDLILWFTKKLR